MFCLECDKDRHHAFKTSGGTRCDADGSKFWDWEANECKSTNVTRRDKRAPMSEITKLS